LCATLRVRVGKVIWWVYVIFDLGDMTLLSHRSQ
jgi:hypothetical protein